jgi:hypothetical protein
VHGCEGACKTSMQMAAHTTPDLPRRLIAAAAASLRAHGQPAPHWAGAGLAAPATQRRLILGKKLPNPALSIAPCPPQQPGAPSRTYQLALHSNRSGGGGRGGILLLLHKSCCCTTPTSLPEATGTWDTVRIRGWVWGASCEVLGASQGLPRGRTAARIEL